jgi:diguanylate cyclase (GGDEF)-like protein
VVLTVMTGFDAYQTPLLRGMREVLDKHGIALVAHVNSTVESKIPSSLVHLVHHLSPVAVVITNAMHPGQEQGMAGMAAELGIPAIYVGREVPGSSCIRGDNVQGMTALMDHLLDDRGARRPVLISGLEHQPDHVDRERVFRQALAERGLPVDEELIVPGRSESGITDRELRALLRRRRDLDAVVALNDDAAMVAIEALRDAGLRVPEEVAVTGFDNHPIAALNWPSLTSVDQDLEAQGATAARLVLERLAGRTTPERVLVPCFLEVRGSTLGTEGSPVSVEFLARSATHHLATQSALMRLGRSLMTCRSLEDIAAALAANLAALAIPRCFLVVYDNPMHLPDPSRCRLVLDYRNGRANPLPDGTFTAGRLLPAHLQGELTEGFLGYTPLLAAQGRLGYLLWELPLGPLPIGESIQMDLGRTMEAVFSVRELAQHSAMLEELVERRTSELKTEVGQRRQAELELQKANAELQRSLVVDGLTQISNRAALDRYLREEWPQLVADGQELAVLMVDVDAFKAFNDRYGHLAGDRALQTVAGCLDSAVRYPGDLACRYGGEEFLVVLPRTGRDEAVLVAERFRRLLAGAAIPHAYSPAADVVTASVGIAVGMPRPHATPETLIFAADRALYRAKDAGRDRIVVEDGDATDVLPA